MKTPGAKSMTTSYSCQKQYVSENFSITKIEFHNKGLKLSFMNIFTANRYKIRVLVHIDRAEEHRRPLG